MGVCLVEISRGHLAVARFPTTMGTREKVVIRLLLKKAVVVVKEEERVERAVIVIGIGIVTVMNVEVAISEVAVEAPAHHDEHVESVVWTIQLQALLLVAVLVPKTNLGCQGICGRTLLVVEGMFIPAVAKVEVVEAVNAAVLQGAPHRASQKRRYLRDAGHLSQ